MESQALTKQNTDGTTGAVDLPEGTSSLLRLPAELRSQIFSYVIAEDQEGAIGAFKWYETRKRPPSHAILYTCRTIYRDAQLLPYRATKFHFLDLWQALQFLQSRNPSALASTRDISVRINTSKLFRVQRGNHNPGGLYTLCSTLATCCTGLLELEFIFDMWFKAPFNLNHPPSDAEASLFRTKVLELATYWFVAFRQLKNLKDCNMKIVFSHRQPNGASFIPSSEIAESLYGGSFIEKMEESIISQSEDPSEQVRWHVSY